MKKVIHLAVLLWMGFSTWAMLAQTSGTQHATTTKSESSNSAKSSDEVCDWG